MKWLKHGTTDARSAGRCVLAVALVILASQHVWAFCFEEAGEKYGVSPQLLWAIAKTESCFNDACYNVQVGAWILSQCVQRHGYTWAAVGCYNAVSKDRRAVYANRVYRILEIATRGAR